MTKQKPDHFAAVLSIKTETPSIRIASDWLSDTLALAKVPSAQIERLAICLNEVLANIIEHGGEQALAFPTTLRLELNLMDHINKASVTVTDSGIVFNPLDKEEKRIPDSLDELNPGGLGLTMMRAFVDELRYEYIKNKFNQLSFSIYWQK